MNCWSCNAPNPVIEVADTTYNRVLWFCSPECRDVQITKKGVFRLRPLAVLQHARNQPVILRCAIGIFRDEEQRVLLLRRAGLWYLPGGKAEGLETDEETLAREILEETGQVVERLAFHSRHMKPDSQITVMVAEPVSKIVRLSPEHDAYGWFMAEEALGLDLAGPVTRQVLSTL